MYRLLVALVVVLALCAWVPGVGEALPTPIATSGPCAFAAGQLTMFGLGPCDLLYQNPDLEDEATLTEQILNSTGQAWHDFHLEIGTSGTFAHASNLWFEDATSPDFTLVSQSPLIDPNTLDFLATGPDVPSGATTSFEFEAYLGGAVVGDGEPFFVIRHVATVAAVPTPAPLALLGLGLSALAGVASLRSRR